MRCIPNFVLHAEALERDLLAPEGEVCAQAERLISLIWQEVITISKGQHGRLLTR